MPSSFRNLARHLAPLLVAAAIATGLRAQELPPPAPPAADAAKPADDDAKPQVAWRGSFADAMRQARAEKRPLLVRFEGEGDAAADKAAAKLWREEKLVEATAGFLCIVASEAKHDESLDEFGEPHCKRHGVIRCADHVQSFRDAARELLGSATPLLPQLVLCTGEGRLLVRRAYPVALAELVDLLEGARRSVAELDGATPAGSAAAATIAKALEDARKARSSRKAEALAPALELRTEAARAALVDYARKGDDDETRVAVIEALASRGDYLLLEPLQALAGEKKEYLALAAIDALGKLALPEARDELKKRLNGFRGNDQGRVVRALAACGPDDPEVRELVLKKAKGGDQNIRAHALVAIGALRPVPELEAVLNKAIFDRLTVARACAVYAAGKGRYEACRDALAKQAAGETHVDLKELAETALAHLDHDRDDPKCCNLESKLENFLVLGDTRR